MWMAVGIQVACRSQSRFQAPVVALDPIVGVAMLGVESPWQLFLGDYLQFLVEMATALIGSYLTDRAVLKSPRVAGVLGNLGTSISMTWPC